MTRLLATFDNAWRVANAMSGDHDTDYALIRTGNPAQPYRVEALAGQPGVIAVIGADRAIALRWAASVRTSESDL